MEELSFEEIYSQVSWELCVEAAANAITDLTFHVYTDVENPKKAKRTRTIETAAEELMNTQDGGVQILGKWKAGGKRGELEIVYVKRFSPTATETYIARFIDELIRLQIAKELYKLGNPKLEISNDPE